MHLGSMRLRVVEASQSLQNGIHIVKTAHIENGTSNTIHMLRILGRNQAKEMPVLELQAKKIILICIVSVLYGTTVFLVELLDPSSRLGLCGRLLRRDAEARWTAEEALHHGWFYSVELPRAEIPADVLERFESLGLTKGVKDVFHVIYIYIYLFYQLVQGYKAFQRYRVMWHLFTA